MEMSSDTPEQPDRYEQLRRVNDDFVQTMKDYKDSIWFWQKFSIPEGEGTFTIYFEDKNFSKQQVLAGYMGEILCKVDFTPHMEPKPVIPTNVLYIAVQSFIDELRKLNPRMAKKNEIYRDVLNLYRFRFNDFVVFPGYGVLHMNDYMNTATYNTVLMAPRPFGNIFYWDELPKSYYNLNPNDLPRFSDDYTSSQEKLVKKAKTVMRALQKGKWRGHTYDLDPGMAKSTFIIHQDRNNYNREDKIISPNFYVGLNLGYEIIDGEKNKPENEVLTPEETKEFRQWIKTKFEHFGIKY